MDENSEPSIFEVMVNVAEAKRRDVGRSIIRLDTETFKKLDIRTGDIIEIKGSSRTTAAIVWPSYSEDKGKGIIRMDGRIRKNAGVSLGEKIIVRKANEKIAREITLAPTNMRITSGDPYVEGVIKRKLLNYPLTQGDLVYIPIGIAREVPFTVISTKPTGVVVIKKNTILKVAEESGWETKSMPIIMYEDIGGLDEQIREIQELIDYALGAPKLLDTLGVVPPKGILLYGPSGCGKTLLAKAILNETACFFKHINGPELITRFFGDSEKLIRAVFDEAQKNAPSIIFIDHIDSVASRITKEIKGFEENTVTQLLALMDGVTSLRKVLVIGATNRINAMDPAFCRPGRFDREIEIGIPDEQGRKEILKIHTQKLPLSEDVNLDKIANQIKGFVGADIAALVREAAIIAIQRILPDVELKEPSEIDSVFVELQEMLNVPTKRDDILKRMAVRQADFEQAERKIRKDYDKDSALDYIQRISKIYDEISFYKISTKTGVPIDVLEDLIEESLLKGEIQGKIHSGILKFKTKE